MHRLIPSGRARRGMLAAFAAASTLAACSTDRILKASDPDLIDPGALETPAGAEGLRLGAWDDFRTSLTLGDAGGEGMWLAGGLLADEWKSGNSFYQTNQIDARSIRTDNSSAEVTYRNLHRARRAAMRATVMLQKWDPTPWKLGQMWLVRGIVELTLGESYCNGVSLADASTATDPSQITYSDPLSNDSLFALAAASFDSALVYSTGGDANSVSVRTSARIMKARALVNRAQYAEAKATVAGIATGFQYLFTYQPLSGSNGIWSLNTSQGRYVVGDSINNNPYAPAQVISYDVNAIPFARAHDPRVPVNRYAATAFDAATLYSRQMIWQDRDSSIALVKGLDARLIEAEADLAGGTSAEYLTTINALRAAVVNLQTGAAAPLAPLADPGTPEGRVAQFFREKAFFQFGRGFRLGDMRREVRQYGFDAESVFPTGEYHKGGNFGTDVNFPIPVAESNNPNPAAAQGCTDRGA
jgi:hypothetical protein